MTSSPTPFARPRLSRRGLLGAALAAGGLGALPRGAPAAESICTRPIPSSGEALPVIGLGTSRVFDVEVNPETLAPRREIVELMLEHGASVIDSSPMYGRAERVVGEIAGELAARGKLFYATKVWTRGERRGIEQMQRSLELFGAPEIDLMQVHNLVDWRTQLATIRDWQETGRIRYSGITHYRVDAFDSLAGIMRAEPIDFVQLNYSLATRAAEERLLPLAAERGIAVLVNRPYEGGSLFRAVRGRELPGWAAGLEIASWGQFFLKYVLSHPAVTCVIPGTSKPRHMRDNLRAGLGPLPDADERARMVALVRDL